MFRIDPKPTFSCEVRLSVPGSDVGAPIGVTFRHKGARALQDYFRRAKDLPDDATYLAEVIQDWSGVEDADGAPVPFSFEALAKLLDAFPAAGTELLMVYRRQLQDARAKN